MASFARHPRRITCLECGFFSLEDKEVSSADRILLHMRGTAGGCPPLDSLGCWRSLWVEYDLTYCGVDAGAILDEVQRDRRNCKGFFRYNSGNSPSDHQELLLKAQERKQKLIFTVIGSVIGSGITLFVTWLVKLFGMR